MNHSFAVVAILAAGAVFGAAQTAPGSSNPAGPIRVAVISFQAAVGQTNEFQRSFGDLQKKFEPTRTQLKSLSEEIESLQKQLQAQASQLSEQEQASRARIIDGKKKQAQRMAEDAQSDLQNQLQQLYVEVAKKVGEVASRYAEQQGYLVVIDATPLQQQSPVVLWANPSTDITKDVIVAYNVKSGVPAPPVQPGAQVAKPSAPGR